jgi:hypothetical protein
MLLVSPAMKPRRAVRDPRCSPIRMRRCPTPHGAQYTAMMQQSTLGLLEEEDCDAARTDLIETKCP